MIKPIVVMARGVVALILCASSLAMAESPPDPLAGAELPATSYQLDNGLTVVLHRDTSLPTVVVHVWYKVGSKDESKGRSGFAHLFEHLMFKGSQHVPDGEFDRMLEAAGGANNGTTTNDRTNYFEEVPANYLSLALYLEADRMVGMWGGMNQEKLDNQRGVVKNERRQSFEDQPYGMAALVARQALWPEGHGNHNLTIGTMEDLSAATLRDVERFYRDYYVPNNAILVIAGNFEESEARRLVDKYFGWMERKPSPRLVTLDASVEPLKGEKRISLTDNVQVPKVLYRWRAPAHFGAGEAELDLAAEILAGGKTSRLYRRLVFEQRLATHVEAYQVGGTLGGFFGIEAVAREGVSADAMGKAIEEAVAALSAKAPTKDELQRARSLFLAGTFHALESLEARADVLAEYMAFVGKPDYFRDDVIRYQQASAAEIRDAVAKWLGADARVVITVTPKEAIKGKGETR